MRSAGGFCSLTVQERSARPCSWTGVASLSRSEILTCRFKVRRWRGSRRASMMLCDRPKQMLRILPVLLVAGVLAAAGQTPKKHRDYVPDEKTAVQIAEAVLIAHFGEERVKAQLPLQASNSYGDVWIVGGHVQGFPQKGGGMAVWINKHSG